MHSRVKDFKLLTRIVAILVTVFMVAVSFIAPSFSSFAGADTEETGYVNKSTSYEAVIIDEAGLLTEGEKKSLLEDMQPITDYGNVMFYTIDMNKGTTIYEGQRRLEERFGSSPNGTVFIIDMANRELSVYSDGAIYRTITRGKASTIVSNVYRLASKGDYYGCASEVFKEETAMLQGAKVAAPMKLASNILLALMLGMLFAFGIVKAFSIIPKASEKELLAAIQTQQNLEGYNRAFTHQTRRYDPPSSSSSGGGGGGGGGGDGGGGGASHGF